MGLIDSVKKAFDGDDSNDSDLVNKAKDAANQHADKIDGAVDQVDERTGGKYADKVDQAQDFLKDKTGNL